MFGTKHRETKSGTSLSFRNTDTDQGVHLRTEQVAAVSVHRGGLHRGGGSRGGVLRSPEL